jgi:hypothetical protein
LPRLACIDAFSHKLVTKNNFSLLGGSYMARISDDQLERLKQEISVQRLAEGRRIVLKRHGADLIGLRPFHDDHEPSLLISPKNNLWRCLATIPVQIEAWSQVCMCCAYPQSGFYTQPTKSPAT